MVYARFFRPYKVEEASPVQWYWMNEHCLQPAKSGLVLARTGISARKAARFIRELIPWGICWRCM
jgi:hypothetical protein